MQIIGRNPTPDDYSILRGLRCTSMASGMTVLFST